MLNSVQPTIQLQTDFGINLGANFGTTSVKPGIVFNQQITAGTAASQADVLHIKTYSVVSGTPLLLNLFDGSLLQPDGSAGVFAELCGFVINQRSVTAGQILTMGAGTNAFTKLLGATGLFNILPSTVAGLVCTLTDAYGPTSGTDKILQFVSSTGTISFDLALWGHSVV